jgi:hypothetical protein
MNPKTRLIADLLLCALVTGVGVIGCSSANDAQTDDEQPRASTTGEALSSGQRLYMINGGYLRNDSGQAIAWIPRCGWVTYYSGSLSSGVVVNWRGQVGHAWGPYFNTQSWPCINVFP